MRSFEFAPIVMILLLTVVLAGAVGLFVVIPVAFFEWSWNVLAGFSQSIPKIASWQAVLLYIAFALVLYISGLVKIEVSIEKPDA